MSEKLHDGEPVSPEAELDGGQSFSTRLLRSVLRVIVRRRVGKVPVGEATLEKAVAIGLEATLQSIVRDVVQALEYSAAMVATYEQGDALPVRALYLDPQIATAEDLSAWEEQISAITGQPVSITDPNVARVFVYQDEYQDNLSVAAAQAGKPVISDDLYRLFTPIVSRAARPIVRGIQQALGIQQIIAVPFFLELRTDGGTTQELVGNLFAAKRSDITERDILILSAFGRQAAAAIGSERRRLQIEMAQALTFRVQTCLNDEAGVLEWIAKGVVSDLGYVGAMVAPYEVDGSLPVSAFYVDPRIATMEDIHQWEGQLSRLLNAPISITNPEIARVYVDREEYRDNLSVRAATAGEPVTSDSLYDLFTPVVPQVLKPVVDEVQKALGIQQVIAVPFFLESLIAGEPTHELVGNLFAATPSKRFRSSEIALLRAFGQQAAAGIRNARLYRKAEERRHAAQMFGKIAFSAATAVHTLRNHIGSFQMYLELLRRLPPARRDEMLANISQIESVLRQSVEILDTLWEPWHQVSDEVVDVNDCLRQALDRSIPGEARDLITVKLDLSSEDLYIRAASDMLTEAFRILMKNAVEAIFEKGEDGEFRVQSRLAGVKRIEVSIEDNGIGIPSENVSKIFDIGWTTKRTGMGFGLYWTKDFIEGLGGRIEVESVLQEGTTFRIRLPRLIES